MSEIVIFGTGLISQLAKVYIEKHSSDRIAGFTVDADFLRSPNFLGLPVVAWSRLEERFPPDAVSLLGPLSYHRLNELRRDRHKEGKARGYRFASFVHPDSHVYTNDIGENCFILENNVIQPFVRIGDGVIIWSSNMVGHHAVIDDYCYLSSQVGLGGNVRIGKGCFLAGKVTVESQVEVGDACFLDTGVLVKKNLAAQSVVRSHSSVVSNYPSSRLKRLRLR